MQVEVKTRMRGKTLTELAAGEVIIDIALLPRGSGNRNAARRLGASFRNNERLKPHLRKVVVGSSRVTVHVVASVELMRIIKQIADEERARRDVPGQMKLFGGAQIA